MVHTYLACFSTLVSSRHSPKQLIVRPCSDSSCLFSLISRVLIRTCSARGKKMFHVHAINHISVIGYYPTHWLDVISGAQKPRGGLLMENKRSIRFGLNRCLWWVFLSVGSPLPVTPLNSLTSWYYVCAHLIMWLHEATHSHKCLKRGGLLLSKMSP